MIRNFLDFFASVFAILNFSEMLGLDYTRDLRVSGTEGEEGEGRGKRGRGSRGERGGERGAGRWEEEEEGSGLV
jgi:hypothetical protein